MYLRSFSSFFVFLLGIVSLLPAQEVSSQGDLYRQKATSLADSLPEKAIAYIQLALDAYDKSQNYLAFIDAQQDLGSYYNAMEKFDQVDSIIELNWQLAKTYLSPTDTHSKETYGYAMANRAFLYNYQEDYLSGLDLYSQAFSIIETLEQFDLDALASYYEDAGIAYRKIGDHEEALRLYRKTEKLHLSSSQSPLDLAYLYMNYGRAFLAQNRWDSAHAYYDKTLHYISNQDLSPLSAQEIRAISLRGKLRVFLGKNPDSTLLYSRYLENFLKSNPQLVEANSYSVLGAGWAANQDYDKAKKYLTESLDLNESGKKSKIIEFDVLLTLALVAREERDFPGAMAYINQALGLIQVDPPSYAPSLYAYGELQALKEKIHLYRVIGSPDSMSQVFSVADRALELANEIRQSFQGNESKLDLGGMLHELLEEVLICLSYQKEELSAQAFQRRVFQFIEANKSLLLYETLLDKEAKLRLPDSLLIRERWYKRNIAYYKKELFELEGGSSSEKKEILSEKLFSSQQRYKRFSDSLSQFFPSYFREKYAFDRVDITEFRAALELDQAVIQFFTGKHYIFSQLIHPDTTLFQRLPLSDSIWQVIKGYHQSLSNPEHITSPLQNEVYASHAHELYSLLLESFIRVLPEQVDQLIVSPDGLLNYLPFEAFLMEKVPEKWVFKNLTYVLNHYALGYTHSATHWLRQIRRVSSRSTKTWLGFAPSYDESELSIELSHPTFSQILTREGAIQLPYAQKEIQDINTFVAGKALLKEAAKESSFRRLAPSYQILHLATHGLIEDERPLYSRLIFAEEEDSLNDGKLHAYEVYNMELNANLAVLSACNTGVGKLEQGEGLMSLSRAFFSAGVKSILMSMWSVSDRSTADLMTHFYQQLAEGKSKSKALQASKLHYLELSKDPWKNHPYFWAGFVLKGDPGSFDLSSPFEGNYWIIGLLILLGMGVIGRRFLQKST